jgi:hypothetical protein
MCRYYHPRNLAKCQVPHRSPPQGSDRQNSGALRSASRQFNKPALMTTATIKRHFARLSIAELKKHLCHATKWTRTWRADNLANYGSIQGERGSAYSPIKNKYKIGSSLYFVFRAIAGQRSSGFSPLCRLLIAIAYLSICRISNFHNFVKLVSHAPLSNAASVCGQQGRRMFC